MIMMLMSFLFDCYCCSAVSTFCDGGFTRFRLISWKLLELGVGFSTAVAELVFKIRQFVLCAFVIFYISAGVTVLRNRRVLVSALPVA